MDFRENKNDIKEVDMLEAATCLARALHYLQVLPMSGQFPFMLPWYQNSTDLRISQGDIWCYTGFRIRIRRIRMFLPCPDPDPGKKVRK